jgi:hypothetical protein
MPRSDADALFQQATEFRDRGDLLEAKRIFLAALEAMQSGGDRKLKAATYSQLAHVEDLAADAAPTASDKRTHVEAAAEYAAIAVSLAENAELPSLQLYISLIELGRNREALEEAVRFLKRKNSMEYRAMLSQRHAEEKDPEIAQLASSARELLSLHAKAGTK